MNLQFTALIPVVFGVVEGLEHLGLKKKIAHILALPLGILLSFFVMPDNTWYANIIYGLIVGLSAAGACDTIGNCKEIFKKK